MQRGTKIYTVDKFLGINEAADPFWEAGQGGSERTTFW